MSKNIVIIGAGDIGQAVGHLLAPKKDLNINFWDLDESKVHGRKDLKSLVSVADFVFLCIPSWGLSACVSSIEADLNSNATIVSLTKGIEKDSCLFTGELLSNRFGIDRVSVLAGPMLAGELMLDIPTCAVLGCVNEVFEKVAKLFDGSSLKLVNHKDIIGVSIASVLKNVYALSLGIADALEMGCNFKGSLVTNAIGEMQEVLKLLKCDPAIAFGFAGLGDLVATGHSHRSKNRTLGEDLIKNGTTQMKSEGMVSFSLLLQRFGSDFKLPTIISVLKNILIDHKSAKEEYNKVFF